MVDTFVFITITAFHCLSMKAKRCNAISFLKFVDVKIMSNYEGVKEKKLRLFEKEKKKL